MQVWYAALLTALLLAGCQSPGRLIRPIVSRDVHEIGARMREAPIIVLAEIMEAWQIISAREVPKPSQEFGPVASTIPLELVGMRARVPLVLRGSASSEITFYSWTWAGGKHGGPRLFHIHPGTVHVLFLRQEGPHLHTVGDYPAHDVELKKSQIPALTKRWQQSRAGALSDMERLTAALIETNLEMPDSPVPHHFTEIYTDVVDLAGVDFIQSQLAAHCRAFPTALGQAAACSAWKWGNGPR